MSSISEVAKKAGVSNSTASFVLNGKAGQMRIRGETVEQVLLAADTLKYTGNYHARALRGKSMTLGVLSHLSPYDVIAPQIMSGINTRAQEHGYEILNIMTKGASDNTFEKALLYLDQRRVDGLIVYARNVMIDKLVKEVHGRKPVVYIWYHPEEDAFPLIKLDPAPGIKAAIGHLAELGHRKALFLGIKNDGKIQLTERLEASRKYTSENSMEQVEYFIEVDTSTDNGTGNVFSHFHSELAGDLSFIGDATAVLCYNDAMALALNLILAQKGIEVPGQLSIIGFDNIQARMAIPALTTISHMFPEFGKTAVETVLDMIESPENCAKFADRTINIGAKLVVRDSTGTASLKKSKVHKGA